jgi:hypothetical protein
MSHISPLHESVHKRLVVDFGPPHNQLGKDHQWTLFPAPRLASIHVLVNGSVEQPAMWVFDPHTENDGIFCAYIRDADHLEEIIQMIHARVKAAANRNKKIERA